MRPSRIGDSPAPGADLASGWASPAGIAWRRSGELLDSAPDALIVIDADGLIAMVNERAESLLGYPRWELVGRPVELVLLDALRPDDPPHRPRFTVAPPDGAELAGSGSSAERELVALRPDGAEIPVSVTLSSLVTGAGTLTIAALRDIGARRRAEAELRSAEELFRTTIDHAPIGIALAAPDGHLLRVNDKLCEMTGYGRRELLTKTFRDLTHPEDREVDAGILAQLLAGETIRACEFEKRYVRADGSILWTQITSAVVPGADGIPTHIVTHVQDISKRKGQENELRHLADHDALTGLVNRRTLGREITAHLARQARYGGPLALLMVDLDHFKYINDTLGHRVGDQIIRAAAEALRSRLRDTDIVSRLGGDEFAILLPHTDLEAAGVVAGEIVSTLAELRIESAERQLRVSASVGLVTVEPGDDYDEATLLAAADLAMYEAKEAGRDRFATYNPTDGSRDRASTRLNWSHRIRNALAEDLFVLHYQAIVDLSDGSNGRYEALIRMADQPGELVEPGSFLHIAERYGLMPAIDQWVIRRVIGALGSGELPPEATIAVNISAASLTDPGLLDLIDGLLDEHHVAPHQLIFEVTESTAISRLEDAERFGHHLKDIGCGFALDDFGTGFGSFVHLKHLPYSHIKIDGEFVRGMLENNNDRILVEAMVRVGQRMGKKTVAEFVGDPETMAELRAMGVDYAQGYHLGRPAPADQLARRTDADLAA